MPKLTIIDGIDGTGKTTLCKEICAIRNAAYMHMSGHPLLWHGMLEYHMEALRSAEIMLKNGMNVVIDRLWMSEMAYGRVLRPSISHPRMWVKVMLMAKELGAEHILCHRSISPEKQYDQLNHSHSFTKKEYCLVWEEFEAYRRNPLVPITVFCRDERTAGEQCDIIPA